jgi:hypothetical protein
MEHLAEVPGAAQREGAPGDQVTLTRKLQPGLPIDEAERMSGTSPPGDPRIDEAILDSAWRVEDRFELSLLGLDWDSLIVAAAHAMGCEVLLTEDLQHDLVIDGLRIVDPFRTGRLPRVDPR